jgi:hypothetical protein
MVSRKLSLIVLAVCCLGCRTSETRSIDQFRGVIYGTITYLNKEKIAILIWLDSTSGDAVEYNPPFDPLKYPVVGQGESRVSLKLPITDGSYAYDFARVGQVISGQKVRSWTTEGPSLHRDTGIVHAVLYKPEEIAAKSFSNIRMSDETGDLIGCELVLVSASGRVTPAVLCTDWGLSSFSFGYDLTGDSNQYTFFAGETTNPHRFTVTRFGNDVIVDRSLGEEPMLHDTLQIKQANAITFMQAASRH